MSHIKLIVILCIASLACQLQTAPIMPTETPTQTPTATLPPTAAPTLTPSITPIPSPTGTPAPPARRVLILSIDGFRPDAIPLAPMPFLTSLLAQSAYSLTAQTVYPSVTLVSHTSMLSGQCPAKHKVDWNDYIPANGYAQVTDLFDVVHTAGMQTVMYVGKEKLRQITEPPSTDIFKFINDRDLVITDDLIANFPADFRLMFVHFPTTDWMGHEYGWLSGEQLSVLFRADQALEKLVTELNNRGLMSETLFIITADHGGHATTHGTSLYEDMTIPWIAFGAGIHPAALTSPITTVDTASTAAFALGLPIPAEWDGVPIYEAFGLPVERTSVGCN
ncbi:MAG: alkaline phosphatase family protein [Anaerolineales bacterium]|nr:alkaline phosphatase family protein [Anaerolineales bacterium]MBK9781759.1 alkaline phosphatase family protein [Anaerolineales bacterium]